MLKKLFRKISIFIHMSIKDKLLFIAAYILSGIARFLMLAIPFKKFQPYIGIAKEESPYENICLQDFHTIKRIRYLGLLACKYTPWESKCLVKALVVCWILKYYKIPTTLYLGVAKDKTLLAHAWLRCGPCIITGGDVQKKFVEVARFSNYKLITRERSCENNGW